MAKPHKLPITASTVSINGMRRKPKDIVWAGFLWCSGVHKRDDKLCVPWINPVSETMPDSTGQTRQFDLCPVDPSYKFECAANGNWILELKR